METKAIVRGVRLSCDKGRLVADLIRAMHRAGMSPQVEFVLADPVGRFHRTFGIYHVMEFGTLDQALAAARRLHGRHAAVFGALPAAAPSAACTNSARCAHSRMRSKASTSPNTASPATT